MTLSSLSALARTHHLPDRPIPVTVTAMIAALGGLLFGYDTGVISGALLFLQKDFRLSPTAEEVAVSAVLVGAILGAISGGRMADRFGRRLALIIIAVIFGMGAILTSVAPNIIWFDLTRVIVGFGIGVSSLVTPIYISEIAPPHLRGRLVTFNQLAITLGISVAYFIDLAFAAAGLGWRPMFFVAIIPAAILGIGMFSLSDTPRWYASQGDRARAREVLMRTGQPPEALDEIQSTLREHKRVSWRELLRPGLRMALIVGVGLAILQQFVGINTIVYYAPTIFGYAGIASANTAILATSVVGIVNVLATILALLLLDKVGRRPLLIWGSAGMALTLTLMGISFAIGPQALGGLVLVCMLGYILSFAIGMGPVFWLLSAEIFPNRLRGAGASASSSANWAANLLISITFLSLINTLGKPATFWLYAAFAVVALIFITSFVPETKGKTLEQIEASWQHGHERSAGDHPLQGRIA